MKEIVMFFSYMAIYMIWCLSPLICLIICFIQSSRIARMCRLMNSLTDKMNSLTDQARKLVETVEHGECCACNHHKNKSDDNKKQKKHNGMIHGKPTE